MALLFRTSQTQRFVSAADPDFVAEGARMVSDRWAYADGQPDGCTVFEVRPLSDAEMAEFVAAEVEADGDADALAAVQRRMALAALRSLQVRSRLEVCMPRSRLARPGARPRSGGRRASLASKPHGCAGYARSGAAKQRLWRSGAALLPASPGSPVTFAARAYC